MNNERIQGLLLRILSGRRRATAYADAHDLAGLNNRPRGGRLVSDGAGRRLVIGRFAFEPTTFGTATVRPRTARYVITPAPKIKTTANSATVSKLLKMLLEPLRESKCVLLIFIRPMQIVSSIAFPLPRYGRGKAIEETICMGRAIDWKGSVASLMFGFQWRPRIADCGLRIADCGFIDSENPAFISSPLRNSSPTINPQSAIRNPQSAILTLPRRESSSA